MLWLIKNTSPCLTEISNGDFAMVDMSKWGLPPNDTLQVKFTLDEKSDVHQQGWKLDGVQIWIAIDEISREKVDKKPLVTPRTRQPTRSAERELLPRLRSRRAGAKHHGSEYGGDSMGDGPALKCALQIQDPYPVQLPTTREQDAKARRFSF
jgi:hypothetical protein